MHTIIGRTARVRRAVAAQAVEELEPRRLLSALSLPSGTRGWETVPTVIRNDGLDSFVLEFHANGPVSRVYLDEISHALLPHPPAIDLTDDGQGADRAAADGVFTAGPFRYDPSIPMPGVYRSYPGGPSGLDMLDVGRLQVIEADGVTTSDPIGQPNVGILRADIPATTVTQLAPDVAVSPHLINIDRDDWTTQRFVRNTFPDNDNATAMVRRLYEVLPDAFDFLMMFSLNRIEYVDRSDPHNGIQGIHSTVQVAYDGTGYTVTDNARHYHSGGRLQSVNALDSGWRSTRASHALHEIMHQWAGMIRHTLGITIGDGHYLPRSSAGSILGGFAWTDNGDGTFTIDCDEGTNGGKRLQPLDAYLMGLIPASEVPPIHVLKDSVFIPDKCSEPIRPEDIALTLTIDEIIALHGLRTPGPLGAQRDFNIGFIAESRDRLLNPTEMTFYEILASHFTTPPPAGAPDPLVGYGWQSITRYFGDAATFRSDVDLRPRFPIKGYSYADFDANGQIDPSLTHNAGRMIFIDADGDGKPGPGELQKPTGAGGGGSFAFGGLLPGTYRFCEILPDGWISTSPGGHCQTIEVTPERNPDDLVIFTSFPTKIQGTPGDDRFVIKSNGFFGVNIYVNDATTPTYTAPMFLIPRLTIDGLAGDDTLLLDFAAAGDMLPVGGLWFDGGDGHDRVEITTEGQGAFAADVKLHADRVVREVQNKYAQLTSVESFALDKGDYTVTGDLAGNLDLGPDATVTTDARQHLKRLTINGRLRVDPTTGPLFTDALILGPDAVLDLTGAALVLRADAASRDALLSSLAASIRSARTTGKGITTPGASPLTTLVATINPGLATFSGEEINENTIIVKHTWNGDANVDGRVNADDYFRIDQGFLAQPQNPAYNQGDFNDDGKINADDYFRIDQAFLGQGAPLAGSSDSSPLSSTPDTINGVKRRPRRPAPADLLSTRSRERHRTRHSARR